jgi:hypothetical protein
MDERNEIGTALLRAAAESVLEMRASIGTLSGPAVLTTPYRRAPRYDRSYSCFGWLQL